MSRQFRYRMAALGLSGLIFGAPLIMNGTARADQVEANDRQVSFGGAGVLGLACGSQPSVESMTVPASSVVRVVNQTGHDAQLRLAGTSKGTIPADGAAEVVFRRGTTAVLLTPDCSVGEDATPVLVTASPSPSSAEPDPTPVPAGGGASVMMSKPADPDPPSRTSAGAARPDAVAPTARPTRTSSKGSRRAARRPAAPPPVAASPSAPTATQAMPQDGSNARPKTRIPLGTAGIGAPAFAGMPPGDDKAMVPGTAAVPPVPPQAGPVATAPAETDGAPVTVGTEPSGFGAAEPVAAVGRIEEGHPLGLLGLTALVCILGVTTAAIRAIVSQRASRTNMA